VDWQIGVLLLQCREAVLLWLKSMNNPTLIKEAVEAGPAKSTNVHHDARLLTLPENCRQEKSENHTGFIYAEADMGNISITSPIP